MVKVFYDRDIDDSLLHEIKVGVIGYGSQGRAQALNLRDSGTEVYVGLREGGKSWKLTENDGFKPLSVSEATAKADTILILIPDPEQPALFNSQILLIQPAPPRGTPPRMSRMSFPGTVHKICSLPPERRWS